MKYVFDNPSFKKYLLSEGSRFKADGLSIWFNMIPIPLDLFDDFFDCWRNNFRLYIDHLMASIILADNFSKLDILEISFKDLPNDNLSKRLTDNIWEIINDSLGADQKYQILADDISSVLGVEDYTCDASVLIKALSHKGKKYDRIFLPKYIRTTIANSIPMVLDKIATRNGDMFGNVVADGIGLYRAGFGDALSALFNKLLDYKIQKCAGLLGQENTVSLRFGKSTDASIDECVIHSRTSDGCLWQPFFDGDLKIKLNPNHSFYSVISDSIDPSALLRVLLKMAEIESNSMTNRELVLHEDYRIKLSRELLDV